MCRLLNVSSSVSTIEWRGRSAREVEHGLDCEQIRAIHKDSNDVYGSLRVHAELVAVHGHGRLTVRVAAPMAAADLVESAPARGAAG